MLQEEYLLGSNVWKYAWNTISIKIEVPFMLHCHTDVWIPCCCCEGLWTLIMKFGRGYGFLSVFIYLSWTIFWESLNVFPQNPWEGCVFCGILKNSTEWPGMGYMSLHVSNSSAKHVAEFLSFLLIKWSGRFYTCIKSFSIFEIQIITFNHWTAFTSDINNDSCYLILQGLRLDPNVQIG